MEWIVLAVAVLGPLAIAIAYRRGHRSPEPTERPSAFSPVTQQHLHLFQGGRLSEAAVESAKARWRDILAHGDIGRADANLQPGLQFAVQVQALAELGTLDAGTILQRQLQRRLSDNPVEQSWYWIDLAHSLRYLNRDDSLPHLLRCPAVVAEIPLGQFFAAETVCCVGFADILRRPTSPLGQSALRLLHSTLRGLRFGVPPYVVGEGKLGEAVVKLWRHKPRRAEPRIVRVFVEALRLSQRAAHGERLLEGHGQAADDFRRQIAEIDALADALTDYLSDARFDLTDDLATADDERRGELLEALDELHADAAVVVIDGLHRWPAAHREIGVRLLRWARSPEVGAWLRDWIERRIRPARRSRSIPRAQSPTKPSVPDDIPYVTALESLRAFADPDVERLLLVAAKDGDPSYRAAAASSLGWWEPFARLGVCCALTRLRDDPNADVRIAAEAALARLGERRALAWFRQSLVGDVDATPDAIRRVAAEGLTWLWPDLDRLADAEDTEIAQHARESLEQLREAMRGGVVAAR
ncbi:MAG: HEAT repeat domain-containing protein [Gemmataceae bacterium]